VPDTQLTALSAIVPREILRVAAVIGRPAGFRAGERLFRAGQPAGGLHLILSGGVRIIRESAGRAVVVHRETAGGLLGEVALFGDGAYPATAVAAEPTTALFLPARALQRELLTNNALAAVFLHRLARRTQEIIRRLDELAHVTVLRRLARHLVTRHQHSAGNTRPVSLGMTQLELAEELGTVKEVVARELRALRRLGLITPAGRGLYRVVDWAALRDLAGR
jgi:CRP/FNR family transcriptional regulator